METTQTGPLLNHPETAHDDHVDDAVLQTSGAGHWFLEGWNGDHSVDSGSLVQLCQNLYIRLWSTLEHQWERWDERRGHCMVQMVLECPDVLTAWYHSWDC